MNRQFQVGDLVENSSDNDSQSHSNSHTPKNLSQNQSQNRGFNFFDRVQENNQNSYSQDQSNITSNIYVDSPYLSVPLDNMYHYLLEPAKGRFPLQNLITVRKYYPKNVQTENTPSIFPFS